MKCLRHAKTAHNLGQKQVAQSGGLSGQNQISKILYNDNLGPTVETFLRGVKGLGLTPCEFFAVLEGRVPPPRPAAAPPTAAITLPVTTVAGPSSVDHPFDDLSRVLREVVLTAITTVVDERVPPTRRKRRKRRQR